MKFKYDQVFRKFPGSPNSSLNLSMFLLSEKPIYLKWLPSPSLSLSNFVYHRTTWGTFRNATYRSSSLWRPSNLVRWRIISEWRLFASSHFDPRIEAFRTPPSNGLYLWRRIQGWNTTQNGFWTTRRRKRCGSCGCQLSCRASW